MELADTPVALCADSKGLHLLEKKPTGWSRRAVPDGSRRGEEEVMLFADGGSLVLLFPGKLERVKGGKRDRLKDGRLDRRKDGKWTTFMTAEVNRKK